jgi:hypothetical protein
MRIEQAGDKLSIIYNCLHKTRKILAIAKIQDFVNKSSGSFAYLANPKSGIIL